MKVKDTEISRICGKHCTHYQLLLDMFSIAEQNMCMARYGTNRSVSETDECHVILDMIDDISPETVVVLCVKVNGSIVVRRQQRFSEMSLKFMHAGREKWISEIDRFFKESLTSVFTAGVFNLSRQKIKDGVFEETDIDTL